MGRGKCAYLSRCYREKEVLLLRCKLVSLPAAAGTNRDHMEGINDVEQSLFVLDDDIMAAYEHELGVRHWEHLAIGRSNS